MSFITRNFIFILFLVAAFLALFFFYRFDVLNREVDANKADSKNVKKIEEDSKLSQANFDSLERKMKLTQDTLKQYKNLAFQLDSIVKNGNKKDQKILKKVYEKSIVIDGLSVAGRDSALTKRGFHPYVIRKRN